MMELKSRIYASAERNAVELSPLSPRSDGNNSVLELPILLR